MPRIGFLGVADQAGIVDVLVGQAAGRSRQFFRSGIIGVASFPDFFTLLGRVVLVGQPLVAPLARAFARDFLFGQPGRIDILVLEPG